MPGSGTGGDLAVPARSWTVWATAVPELSPSLGVAQWRMAGRNKSAPTVCQTGSAERKNGAPTSPTPTETNVISFGVMSVSASQREMAMEIGRSTCLAMKPSVSLTRTR